MLIARLSRGALPQKLRLTTLPRTTRFGCQPVSNTPRGFFTVIQQYEKGLVFRSGRHTCEKEPGIRFNFPPFNEIRKVDMRTRTMQIPSQELMTKDNVTIHVDAVAFFRINDAFKALCNIEDCEAAVSEAAQTSIRDQLSTAAFDEVLHDREEAGRAVLAALCKLTDNWGVVVDAVKLKNIRVDESMIRTMGRRAEAERIRESRIIEADAELQASKKLFQAGIELGDGALGLRLRELQTFTQIAAEKNAMVIPANFDPGVVHAMRHLGRQQRMKLNQGTDETPVPQFGGPRVVSNHDDKAKSHESAAEETVEEGSGRVGKFI